MLKQRKIKEKICKYSKCKKKFLPPVHLPLAFVCSPPCAYGYAYERKLKNDAKQSKEEIKTLSLKVENKKLLLKILQAVFNTYIRVRDKDEPCISCGTTKTDIKYDAGHYYHANYSYLATNEDNVHKQCSFNCNMNLSGNLVEYRPRLIERIGLDRVLALDNDRHKERDLSIEEVKELTTYYRVKTKLLK